MSGAAGFSARVVVLDGSDGSVVRSFAPGECEVAWLNGDGYSPNGEHFSITTGSRLCGESGRPDEDWAIWYETDTWKEIGTYSVPDRFHERVRVLTGPDRLVVSSADGTAVVSGSAANNSR